MKTVRVELAFPYDILIARGGLATLGKEIASRFGIPLHIAIISDETVDALYGDAAEKALLREGFCVTRLSFPEGEEHKTLQSAERLLRQLSNAGLSRTDLVIALGGGITGDVAGFVSAVYLRGIRFVQVPTTLLAAVDSSVGGKTGVNLDGVKNRVGVFWQPSFVLCDPELFSTLPPARYADGMAEVIKYGAAFDLDFLDALDRGCDVEEIILRSLTIKARVVAEDEHDNGIRQLLNFGHTIGHAIEKWSGGEITHGHAVALGMVFASEISERIEFADAPISKRLKGLLVKNGLPVAIELPMQEIFETIRHDKKRRGEEITLILPKRPGDARLYPISMDALREVLLA